MAKSIAGGWSRWRFRAAIAVLAGAIVVAAGYLTVEYRKAADLAAASGDPALPGGTSLLPAPGVSGSLPPSALPSGSTSASAPASASASPKPGAKKSTTEARRPGGFPGPGNTGVPAGTKLAAYSGPCTVNKNGTVISGKVIRCDPLNVRAQNVVIRSSQVIGSVDTTEGTAFSFTLEDSEVDGGVFQRPALGLTNMTVRRSEVRGGQANVLCYANCDVRDSWLHSPGLKGGADWHLNAFLANDTAGNNRSDVTLINNTLDCDTPQNSAGGGCSGDLSLFADFGPVSHVTVRGNLFGASADIAYCVYGGSSEKAFSSGVRNIVFEDNVFQRGSNGKCGYWGAITSFDTGRPGNVWKNNRWDDGETLQAAN